MKCGNLINDSLFSFFILIALKLSSRTVNAWYVCGSIFSFVDWINVDWTTIHMWHYSTTITNHNKIHSILIEKSSHAKNWLQSACQAFNIHFKASNRRILHIKVNEISLFIKNGQLRALSTYFKNLNDFRHGSETSFLWKNCQVIDK